MLAQSLARTLLAAVLGVAAGGLGACADRTEPRPSPIVARRLGGDSLEYGAVLRVCRPEDVNCVPVMAVACKLEWMGDSSRAAEAAAAGRLPPAAEAWCGSQPDPGPRK